MKKIVIFDLDGTLLDTIGDLAASCDEVLRRYDLPTYSEDQYREFVGTGVLRLVEMIIPEERRDEAFVKRLRGEFVEYYHQNIDRHTKIYSGVGPLLKELRRRDVDLAVASNKFQEGTRKLIANFFPNIRFEAVLGQRPNVEMKPNPQIIRDIMNLTSYSTDKILFVGDSAVDIETARAASVESVGVTWGFRSREELEEAGADYIVDTPREILKLLE